MPDPLRSFVKSDAISNRRTTLRYGGSWLAGAATRAIGPQRVVAIAGALGVTAAALLATDWARQRGALTSGLDDDRPGRPGRKTDSVSR